MSSTLITFEGLMIFHHDQSDLYEVGVVDTRDLNHHFPRHDFEVAITPDPHVQQGKWVLGPADLDPYLHQGNSWSLNVEDAQGNLLRGILVDESFPNRHSQDPADRRFGWIINLES